MLMINIRGVSPVIATVLLLVLTIIIGGLDTFEGVEFPESKFNCFDSTKTGFSVKINKEKINGVRVALIDSSGGSDVYDIKSNALYSELKMFGPSNSYNSPLTFPSVGGQRTYVARKVYEKAEISALTSSGDVCSVADVIEFKLCDGVTL
jgi:flagellin-like protein